MFSHLVDDEVFDGRVDIVRSDVMGRGRISEQL